MKKSAILIFLFSIQVFSAQNCIRTKQNEKWPYFAKYKEPNVSESAQQKVIKDNWEQYFKKDILKEISVYDYFPLMLDSYGSPYADEQLFKDADDSFFEAGISRDVNNIKYSMYGVFKYKKNRKLLERNISGVKDSSLRNFYQCLLKNDSYDNQEFYRIYDPEHFKILYKRLKVKLKGKKKILFFIHGYNVPYSLACVQTDALMDILKNRYKVNTDEILLIPIFWSSNNAKKSRILSKKHFSTKNKESFGNGKKYWFYSNRAYYAAITLRKVINQLDKELEILIFSHSLGTTISTSAVINTTSKFHLDSTLKPVINKPTCNHPILEDSTNYYNRVDGITTDIVRGMVNTPIPKQSIKIFLSAAAIPGEDTFIDMEPCILENKKFYVSINSCDEMLTKDVARRKLGPARSLVNAGNFSASSLGCNWKGDADSTLKKYPFNGNFQMAYVSANKDHEIFTYMNQSEYLELIRRWFYGED